MIEKQRKGKPPKLLKKDDVVFKFHDKKIVVSIIQGSLHVAIWPLNQELVR
jgi:hypothetical protein